MISHGPTTGLSFTRTTSPRRGLVLQGMMDLLFQGVVFFLDFQVKFGHVLAAFRHCSAQLVPPLLPQPIAEQSANKNTAPFRGYHVFKRR
jgi:hypothetical protein